MVRQEQGSDRWMTANFTLNAASTKLWRIYAKHGVSFDLASTIFRDSRLLTVADVEHSAAEERWFSVGYAVNGVLLSVVYLWLEEDRATKVRMISPRRATQNEICQYHEVL